MIAKRALLVSAALNLVALAVVLCLLADRPRQSERQLAASSSTNSTHETMRSLARKAASFPSIQRPVVQFDWRQVESEDYREYIANLRAVGCPEKTIRDIILADVKELFASRRAQILPTNPPAQFWRANSQLNLSEEQRNQLQELAAQKRGVLKSLIGTDGLDAEDFVPGPLNHMAEMDRRMGFLPENKRRPLAEIFIRSTEREQWESDPGKMAASAKQVEAEIDALLTPQERYEYDLRESILAAKVRAALMEMEPNEQEFRTIYDAWTTLFAASQRSETDYLQAREESDREILQLVGPERFERYLNGARVWGYGK